MGAKFRHRYANAVVLGGLLRDAKDEGVSAGGGRRARVWLDNPCDENERFDLHVPVLAIGNRLAAKVLELAGTGALVTVQGEWSTVRSGNELNHVLVAERIIEQL